MTKNDRYVRFYRIVREMQLASLRDLMAFQYVYGLIDGKEHSVKFCAKKMETSEEDIWDSIYRVRSILDGIEIRLPLYRDPDIPER